MQMEIFSFVSFFLFWKDIPHSYTSCIHFMEFTKIKSPLNKNVYTMTVQTEKERHDFVPTMLKDKSREKAEHNSSKRRAGDKNR